MNAGEPINVENNSEALDEAAEAVPEQKKIKTALKPVHAITGVLSKQKTTKHALHQTSLGMLWDVSDDIALSFIIEIERRFRRKNKRFGYFSGRSRAIPRELKDYFEESEDKAAATKFQSFADTILVSLKTEADEVGAARSHDGNVVVMHYSTHDDDDLGRILIVYLDKKSMFDFDQNLRPEKLEPIDTTAIKQAALIDLNLMSVCYPKNDGEAYLKFIEGSSKGAFFKNAIGCDDKIDNRKSVEETHRALDSFIDTHDLDLALGEKLRDGLDALMREHSSPSSEPLNIEKIQSRLDSILPENSAAKGTFQAYVNDNEFEVNSWFSPTIHLAKKAGKIVLKDANQSYSVEVSKNSIGGMSSGKPVKLSDDGEYLCFPLIGEDKDDIEKLVLGSTSND